MAFQIEVTKISVSEQMHKLWGIVLNLTCWPQGVTKEHPVRGPDGVDMKNAIIFEDFSLRYRTGQDVEAKVKEVEEQMQDTIDEYKGEQTIFNHTKLDIAVTYLNNNLVG